MPQLYTFVVCDKAIIDDGGVVSLISLFGKVILTLQDGKELPANSMAPKEWAVFASWDYEPSDEGKEYSQVIQVQLPDGTSFIDRLETQFVIRLGSKQQVKAPIVGFPVGQVGNVTVRMWLEFEGRVVFEARPIHIEVAHTPPA